MTCSKEEKRLRGVGALLNLGRICGIRETCCGVRGTGCAWLANCRPPRKGHCRPPQDVLQAYWGKCEAFFILAGTQQRRRTAWLHWKLRKSGMKTVTFVKRLWLAYRRPPHKGHLRPPHKGHLLPPRRSTVLMLRIVQFVNGLRHSNKWRVRPRVLYQLSRSCPVLQRA